MLFNTIGGLGLFLFGMGLMSDGLKKVAAKRLRKLLESLTRRPVVGVLVGALVTCLIQSSSATTVMTVGFVNAGLLSLKQALCVVLGANVGTTMTAWLVSGLGVFKITRYALPAIGLGFLMQVVCKTRQKRSIGQIILGFGILFIGISFMKDAFSPLKDSAGVQEALIWLGGNPLLAVLAGTVITMLLQSSSASIAMIQTLAFGGAFGSDWRVALAVTIPFILGDNIGTTITAQIAAFRTSRNARRVAWGHTVFNVLGVCYILPLLWLKVFAPVVMWVTPGEVTQATIMLHIAVAHSMFNVFNTFVFLPLIGLIEKLMLKVLPVTAEEVEQQPVVLEERLLDTPVIALSQAKRELLRMAKEARRAVESATSGLMSGDVKKLEATRKMEDLIDEFQVEITSYLVELSKRQLGDEVSIELPVLLHVVNDLERVGDHAVNIVEIAERKIEQKIVFGETATKESNELVAEVFTMLDRIIVAMENDDVQSAHKALGNENRLNKMQVGFRRSHVQRMTDGTCSAAAGLIFIDLVDNVEKIGDHLTNIAQSVIGGVQWYGVDSSTLSGEYDVNGV
jgi:phosphate:Na+ symporter